MKLSPARLNAMLNQVGQTVDWRPGYDCPCKNPDSGAAEYGCPNCGGFGITWGPPQSCKTALAGQKIQREWANFGMWENGDVILSIPSDSALYAIGEFDRVTFAQSSEPFSLTRKHDGSEKLTFPVASLNRVFWLADGVETEGGIPTVNADGTLTWTDGMPPDGVQFSITGPRRPEYFCFGNFPQDRAHQGGDALPRRIVLRRFDLFGRSGT